MLVSDFIDYLELEFPAINFFEGTIDRNLDECIGVYLREGGRPFIAIGGPEYTSFNSKPLSILIHWTESANQCEVTSNLVYNFLFGKSNFVIGNKRVASIEMLDSGPINISRDENNICEMAIRINIIYDKEATYV